MVRLIAQCRNTGKTDLAMGDWMKRQGYDFYDCETGAWELVEDSITEEEE